MKECFEFVLHRIGALLGSDLADPLILPSSGDRLLTFPLRMGERFLDVNILAGLHGPNRRQAVPMVAGRDDDGVDVGVFDEFAKIGRCFRIGKSGFGFRNAGRVRIGQSDDLHAGNFGETPHEFVGSSAATEKCKSDLVVGRRMGSEAAGESCGTKGRLGEELTSSQFGGFHGEECNRKQKGSGGMGQGPADGQGTCLWAGSGDGSGRGQESFPGTVTGILQRHGDPRVGRWSYRIAQEFHAGLSWRTPPLFAVATHTRANDIFPSRLATLGAWHDVVEAQLAHRSGLTAVLAAMGVAGKERFSVETDSRFRDAIVENESDDSGYLQFPRRGFDVIFAELFFHRVQVGKLAPIFEVVVDVLIVLDRDHLGTATVQERHGTTHIDHTDGHIKSIQNQHTAI